MSENVNFVPVLLGSDINAYSMARAFHEEYGIQSVMVARDRSGVTGVGLTNLFIYVENKRLDEKEEFLNTLKDVMDTFGQDKQLLLIGCADHYVRLIVENKGRLLEYGFVVPYSDKSVLDNITLKENFYILCDKYDVEYPLTYIYKPWMNYEIRVDFPTPFSPTKKVTGLRICSVSFFIRFFNPKQNDEYLNYKPKKEYVKFYYEKDELLFSRRCLKRRGEISNINYGIAVYSKEGQLEETYNSIKDVLSSGNYSESSLRAAIKSNKPYKGRFFYQYDLAEDPKENIEVKYICEIDGLHFIKQKDIANYCNVTPQAVSSAKQHHSKIINGKEVTWNI